MRALSILLIAGSVALLPACDTEPDADDLEVPVDEAAPAAETGTDVDGDDATEARELAMEAAQTVQEMNADTELSQLIGVARGVFIMPDYGRGAAVVGAQGGEGVLVARQGDQWTGPAFYDVGGISVGAQAGVEAGQVVLLLMNDEAVSHFQQQNNFALTAEAGVTIIDYSQYVQGTASDSDVVVWTDTEGAFAGASLSISDIAWDDDENQAYYGSAVTAGDVITGVASPPQGDALQQALSGTR